MTSTTPALEATGISKSFPGVKALENVELRLYPGTVTALIGENGAGKSTLVKILTGVYTPDSGSIALNGTSIVIPDAESAFRQGITATHQETVLFDELTVMENIFLGHPITGRFGLLDWRAMRARAREILAELEVDLDPDMRLRDLAIARKHLVAIARALSIDARIVIMDEPTASLSHKEVEELYSIVGKLKREGKAILFISHKFEEIFRIADEYAVFRDGRSVGSGRVAEATASRLISLMVGRTVDQVFPKVRVPLGETVFAVEDLSHPTEFADISFSLQKGEILGFYGLVGSGRSEIMQALFGVTRPSAGRIALSGKAITIRKPADAVDAGIVYVPEERQRAGAILPLPVFENMTLPSLHRITRRGFLDLAREFDLARKYATRLDLRASSLSQEVGTLSGGNQQKVVIGRWLNLRGKVLMFEDPTAGVDVGAKAEIYQLFNQALADGAAIILISTDFEEVANICHRALVFDRGKVVAELAGDSLSVETLLSAASASIPNGGTAAEPIHP